MATLQHYKQAPLPFAGQKRQFLNHFKSLLNKHLSNDGKGWTIVDAFGGSGLLSHVAKRVCSKARVIYNDYDNYAERIAHIDEINELRKLIAPLVAGYKKNERLSDAVKSKILKIIDNYQGYKDPHVICSWLLFSGKQIASLDELQGQTFWNCLRMSDYPKADDYLKGIEVVHESFRTLIPKFTNKSKVLLVLDPPYLCTQQKSYKQDSYFDLIDFLRLTALVKPPFIFFSSTKSEFIRYLEYLIEIKGVNWKSFEGYERIAINAGLNFQVSYEDNLVYKF